VRNLILPDAKLFVEAGYPVLSFDYRGFGGSSPVWLRNRKRGPRVPPRKRTRYVLPLIVTGGSTFAIRLTGDRLGVKAAVAWRAIRSGWRGGFVRT
jgi:pimeloyl-ACP methyl ester carboxylesterase